MEGKRDVIAKKVYGIIHLSDNMAIDDPDWSVLQKNMTKIEENDLDMFYDRFVRLKMKKDYLSVGDFLRVVDEYVEEKANAVWANPDLAKKSERLLHKLKDIAESLVAEYEKDRIYKGVAKQEFWKAVKINGKPVFNEEELDVIKEIGYTKTFEVGNDLLMRRISMVYAKRDIVEKAWKSVITKKIIGTDSTAKSIENKGDKNLPGAIKTLAKKVSLD